MTRGDKDAQQFPVSRFQPLYCLRGKVWSRPILFVANPDLFKKMRWTAHGSTRKRSQMADVRYADCTAAQQHLWAGRRFRKHTKVCPPSTYEVAGRPSVVWKKKMRGSNMWLSTDPWSISRKVAARSVKVEFPSRFSPSPSRSTWARPAITD